MKQKGIVNCPAQSGVLMADNENNYYQSKKEMASPYNLSYMAAWVQRPKYADPYVPVMPKLKEPKRTVILILIMVLMVALIAVIALSYLAIMPEYSAMFSKPAGDGQTVLIGVNDIVNSTLRKLGLGAADVDSGTLIFYTDCLADVDGLELPYMIAYYALPVALILTLVIAVYVLIKSITGLAGHMKRKKFVYIVFLQLLFSLLGAVSGFVWSKAALADFMGFVTGGTAVYLGIGYLAVLGIETAALILSFFAYKSKKQSMKEAQAEADRINEINCQRYYNSLPPNTIVGF
jgi:hypothetical protein